MSSIAPPASAKQVLVFQKDNYFVGKSDTFDGYQEQMNLHDVNWPGTNNNESTDYSSLVVGANVYLTLYDEVNCTGNHITFFPESSAYDLMYTESGNWDNRAKSFKMTATNPYPGE